MTYAWHPRAVVYLRWNKDEPLTVRNAEHLRCDCATARAAAVHAPIGGGGRITAEARFVAKRERAAYVRRRYGLSIDGLERLLERQQGACGICRRPWLACPPAKRTKFEQHFLQHLCIDHDHKTGQIRGLLCNACNTAIGLFEEDIFRLTGAIAYVTLPTREPSSTRRVDTSRHDASV